VDLFTILEIALMLMRFRPRCQRHHMDTRLTTLLLRRWFFMASQNCEGRVRLVAMIRNMFHSIDYPSVGMHVAVIMICDELANVSGCGKLDRNFKRAVANEVLNSHHAEIIPIIV
jgi:hypothetical protein